MKIQLPIDTSAVSFIDVMPPEPVLDRLTKQPKADANGEPLYSIELLCIGEKGGEVLQVKFPGTPSAEGPNSSRRTAASMMSRASTPVMRFLRRRREVSG